MKGLKVKVGGDTSGFDLMMAKVRGQTAQMGRSIGGGLGNKLAGFFTMGAIEEAIRGTMRYAGELTDMSSRTGVAVESLQRLDRATKDNGTSLEGLVGFWERVGAARASALKDPGGSDAKAFKRMGVDQQTLAKGSADDITRQISVAFQNTTNVDELIAPLREIAGRGAGAMVALLRAGYDQEYQDLRVMTGEQADLLDELDDKWGSLGQTISVGITPLLIKMIDAWNWLQDKLTSILTGFFVAGNKDVAVSGVEAYAISEAENKAEREKLEKTRKERVKNRLKFGDLDLGIEPKAGKKPTYQAIKETQLDDLSKAGLFAGGAGSGMGKDNTPERQLAVMEDIANEARRTNTILEEGL